MANAKPSSPSNKPKKTKVTVNSKGKVTLPKDYKLPQGVTADEVKKDNETGQLYFVRELASGTKVRTNLL